MCTKKKTNKQMTMITLTSAEHLESSVFNGGELFRGSMGDIVVSWRFCGTKGIFICDVSKGSFSLLIKSSVNGLFCCTVICKLTNGLVGFIKS